MPGAQFKVVIRDIDSLTDIESMLRLEKDVWGLADADVTPSTLAIALRAAGSILVGAFDGRTLAGFALAFPSLEAASVGFHSHMLAVHPLYREHGLGFQLKLAQRERALALGIKGMTWTFDPLRSTNAHLNFQKLGVISNSYRPDFYGPQTSSLLHSNGTDRLWVTWRMEDERVRGRLNGNDPRPETLDTLKHLEPLVRFNGDSMPAQADLAAALSKQRVAIEIPGDIGRIEKENRDLAREWRLATRHAFSESLRAGFVATEFCRSIRGQQGPGAYLLEKSGE
jgi:predicted GNAT superfamily acetyltransferase